MTQDEAVARFREDGFCILPKFFGAETVAALRATTAALQEGARGIEGDHPVYDFEPSHRPDRPRIRRIQKPHDVHPTYGDLARDTRLLDLIERLVGPNIRLHHSKVNLKVAGVGSPLEWHQDWAFIPHSNLDLAIVSILIDDVTMEKGPVLLLPGSHLGPLVDHHHDGKFYGAIDVVRAGLAIDKAVPVVGPAGTICIHHPMTIHGSALNRSGEDRRILFYEYAAADAWPVFQGIEEADFAARIVRGAQCWEPRLEKVYIKMPFPKAAPGQIYNIQTQFANRFFDAPPAA
jgi:phytanoyl-CoA hydroxylase